MTDIPPEQPADLPEPGDEASGSVVPPAAHPRHLRVLLAGAVVVALVGVLVFAVRPVAAPVPSLEPSQTAGPTGAVASPPPASGYLADRPEIEQRVAQARQGVEPYATALEELLAFAEEARFDDPRPKEPLNISGTDGPFVEDAAAAYGLALAYVATGDVAYAEAARRYLMAWATTN